MFFLERVHYGVCVNCGFDGEVHPRPLIGTQYHPELQNEVLLCKDCFIDWDAAWYEIVFPELAPEILRAYGLRGG